jgi:hypothetical protein
MYAFRRVLRYRAVYQASGLAVAILLPGFATGFAGAAEADADTATSREILRQAHQLSQDSFRIKIPADRQERFKRFRDLLSRLATAGPDVTGPNASEQMLLRVARQAGSRGEPIDELLREYAVPKEEPGFTPRVQRPVPLDAKHVTEKYRPAWEALLLAPPSDEIDFMQRRFTITDALAMIGDRQSLPVLEVAFSAASPEGVHVGEGSRALERQFRILETINRFATEEALQAMLRCLSRAEATAGGPLPRISGRDLREWTLWFLRDEGNYKNRDKWRRVLSEFPTNNLPASQRELVERAAKDRPDQIKTNATDQ